MLNPMDNRQVANSSYSHASTIPTDDPAQITSIQPPTSTQYTAENFDQGDQRGANAGSDQPVLAPPTTLIEAPGSPQNYRLALLNLQQILSDSLSQTRQSNRDLNSQAATNRSLSLNSAVDAVNLAKGNWKTALEDLENKNNQLEQAEKALTEKSAEASNAQAILNKNVALLEVATKIRNNNPNDPLVEEKYQLAKSAVEVSQQELTAAQLAQSDAETARNSAATAALDAADRAVTCKAEADRCTADLVAVTDDPYIGLTVNENDSAIAKLMKCIAHLGKLIQDSGTDKLSHDRAVNIEQQRVLQEKLEKQAIAKKKADDDAKAKAEQRARRGKIANICMIIAGAAALPFSGGASAALIIAGTAVAITDMARESQGKETLTQMAMDPIISNVITPVIKALADQLAKTGMSEETAQIIAAAVVMTACVVAMAAVASKAVGAADEALAKIAPQVIKDIAGKLAVTNAGRSRILVNAVMSGGNLTNTVTQGKAQIDVADSQALGVEANAETGLSMAQIALIQDTMQSSIKTFCAFFVSTQENMQNSLADCANGFYQTNQRIIKHMSA